MDPTREPQVLGPNPVPSDVVLTVAAPGVLSNDSATATVSLTVTSVSTHFGILLLNTSARYTRLAPAVKLDASATLLDGGRSTFGGGQLVVQVATNAATGLFKGRFRHAVSLKTARYFGAVLQEQDLGAGFFLGTTEGGTVSLEPTE